MKRRRVGLILTALLVALCVLVSGCGKNLQAASGNSEGTESSGGISAAGGKNGPCLSALSGLLRQETGGVLCENL